MSTSWVSEALCPTRSDLCGCFESPWSIVMKLVDVVDMITHLKCPLMKRHGTASCICISSASTPILRRQRCVCRQRNKFKLHLPESCFIKAPIPIIHASMTTCLFWVLDTFNLWENFINSTSLYTYNKHKKCFMRKPHLCTNIPCISLTALYEALKHPNKYSTVCHMMWEQPKAQIAEISCGFMHPY